MEADAESPVTPVPGGLGSRALRNTALLLGARVVSRLLALVTFFGAAASLGAEALAIVVEAGILVSLTLLGVRLHMGVAYYLWAYAASYAFSCVFFSIVIAARRIARLGWQLEPAFLLHWLRLSLPFAA